MFRHRLYDYEDVRARARARLPWMIFDYIDGAAGQGRGVATNRAALNAFPLHPRALVDVSVRDLSVQVLGQTATIPFGVSPMGMCNLAHPDADRAYADLAATTGAPVGLSTFSSTDMETMLDWSAGKAWFQLYFSGDGSHTMALAARARDVGYQTLIITLDVPEVGHRPRELRHGFKMPFQMGLPQIIDFACHPRWSLTTLARGAPKLANFAKPGYAFDRTESRAAADWSFFKRLRDLWPGRLVAKGVTHVDDAQALFDAGADALQISSHGSRQLEGGIAPFTALQNIRAALGPNKPLFYDSGIQSGEDIVRAYLAGADFVFLGRYMQYAAAAGGKHSVQATSDFLKKQISNTMAQLGKRSLQ